MANELEQLVLSKAQKWLDGDYDEATKKQVRYLMDHDRKELTESFYKDLEFGTGGLRGIMGVGTNRMNVYTVGMATQGLANYLKKNFAGERIRVAIGHDSRNNSRMFAERVADIFASNGFTVFLFDKLRPTPELSFAIRELKCHSGVVVTASHNPKEYNGYKVYWSDGAQLPPQHAAAVAEKMSQLDIFKDVKRMDFDAAVEAGMVTVIGAETDEAFLSEVMKMSIDPAVVREVADDFKIVYTPFHGCGHKLVPEALRRLGVKHLYAEPKQMIIDGNFPTVKSPNPENPEGFYLAVDLAKQVGSDLIIGTDPDSDRVGTMVRGKDGEYHTITGNQMGVLLLDYIINAKKANGTMPENPAFIKTIVTTNMGREIAERNGVHVEETFTGFKFMAEKLAEYKRDGSYNYILAYEESYGYMMGDYVRDKDAVTASMLIAEMAASYFKKGMTLADALDALYEKYGWFGELTLNLVMPGLDGLEKMRGIMASLRAEPPKEIGGSAVLGMRDYQSGTVSVAELGVVGKTPIVGSNVLYFELDDGTAFIVRPSGTEPKIKVYILAQGESRADCDERIARYKSFAESLNK